MDRVINRRENLFVNIATRIVFPGIENRGFDFRNQKQMEMVIKGSSSDPFAPPRRRDAFSSLHLKWRPETDVTFPFLKKLSTQILFAI